MRPGQFNLEEPAPEEPGMLMTSMIDIIFILLAFFVCVTELKKGHLDVDVPEVPAADAAEPETGEPLVVDVTSDNRIFVDGVEAEDGATLDRLLDEAVRKQGQDMRVHLAGDREAKNGTMMLVYSHLSRAGVKNIEIAVEAGG